MKIILSSIFYTLITFLFIVNASASETLSYSGRLVNPNGSPVVGPVNLKVELAYSNSPTIIRCSQNFTNIILSNGVFHLNVNFDCGSPVTLSQVLTQIPANESAAIRVTNITDPANPKVYSFQALHSMPFANIAETAKQLVQMEATEGQVLKWDTATARWKPGPAGGGGTVTSVSGTLPISVATGSSTAVISMPVANTSTSGYLSSADWNSFNTKEGTIAGGTALQYYRGDKSWQTLNTSVVPESGVTNLYFSNARVLGVPLDGFVAGPGVIVATDTVLQAFAKTQGQINSLTSDSAKYLIKNGTDSITGVVTVTSPTGFLRLIDPPALFTDATNMAYVNSRDDLKVNKAGDTMSGVLTLDSDLKMKGGANYVTLKGHATSATYNLFLPQNAGTSGFVLSTDGNGNTTWINPASVANGTDTVTSASIVNGSIVDADINASAAIDQSKIANLSTDLAGKEPTVTNPSDTSKYYRGDKSWQTLNTTAVAEGTNLYFTNARVLGTDLLGLNTGVAGPIIAADTVLGAFGKLQYQVTDLKAKGQWEKNVNDIYYNAGNVGIGTNSPKTVLDVNGAVRLGSEACSAAKQGAIQYNSTTSSLELCDGVQWRPQGSDWLVPASSLLVMKTCPVGWLFVAVTNGPSMPCEGASCQVCQSPSSPSLVPANGTLIMESCPSGWQTLGKTSIGKCGKVGCQICQAVSDSPIPRSARVLAGSSCPTGWNDIGATVPSIKCDGAAVCRVCEMPGGLNYPRAIVGGSGGATSSGGDVGMFGGTGGGTVGAGGSVLITGGTAVDGVGGPITITAGSAASSTFTARNGGGLNLSAGAGVANGNGGSIFIHGGSGNGTGLNGNILISTSGVGNVGIGTASPQAGLDVAMTGTGNSAIIVPRDTTANRPTTPVNGMIRYNTTSLKFEAYQNGVWTDMIASGAGTITSINGSSDAAQTFANGTSGTAPAWSTAAGVHTINIPMAATAGVTAGLISKTDYDAFNSKLGTTLNSGNIWVGNASNAATAVAPSSDVSMTNAGAFTVTKLQGQSVSTTAPVLGSFLKWDNILSQWAPTPLATCSGTNQVMHYILLTDTWSCDTLNIDNLLPTQTANSGKVLTTNGTTTSWQTPAGVTGSGTTNYLPKFTAASTLGNSLIFDNGTKVGVGTNAPVNTLSVNTPYGSASNSGSAANGGFRLMNTTDAVVLDMGIGINTTAWLQARDPSNYATVKNLLLNPVGGNVTVGGKNEYVALSTNTFAAANGVLGVIGNDLTSASSFGIMVLANNRTTPVAGDTAGELRFSMNNNPGYRDMAFITSKAEGAGGASGFGGNLLFSLKSDNVNSAPAERMRITSSGKVGINDSAPEGKLSVRGLARGNYAQSSAASYYPFNSAGQGDSFVEITNVNTGYGSPGSFLGLKTNAMSSTPYQRAYIGVVANMGAANYTPDIIIGHQTGATAYQERVRIDALGNVGIGTTTPGTGTKLNVQGQIRSKSFTTTLGAIDWQNGNSGTTSFNCASSITFANLRDGGSYTLVVTDTGTTTCSFSTTTTGDDAATVSYRFLPANANRTASTHSLYSLQRIGTTVYVSWMTGF